MVYKALGTLIASMALANSIEANAATFRRLGSINGGPSYVSPDGATAANLSADGNVITGQTSYNPFNGGQVGFRWTWDDGMKWLEKPDGFFGTTYDFTSFPHDLSADGSVIVGQHWARVDPSKQAFRWTAADGMTAFPSFESLELVSPDGQIMLSGLKVFDATGNQLRVLPTNLNDGSPLTNGSAHVSKVIQTNGDYYFYGDLIRKNQANTFSESYLCRWNLAGVLEILPNSISPGGHIGDVTTDGSLVLVNDRLWTAEKGFHQIPGLTGAGSAAGMSGDGKVIVFNTSSTPFIWDEQHGARALPQLLAQEYGLADQIAGWNLYYVYDVADDGTVISGEGRNPQGEREYWVVDLRPVPEPQMATLCVIAAIALVAIGARDRAAGRTR
jgi:uncharacterized membrane protein